MNTECHEGAQNLGPMFGIFVWILQEFVAAEEFSLAFP